MKMMLCAFLAMCAVACSSTNSTTIPQYDLSDVTITMRRTACFGMCPVYTVTIYGSGKIEFRGDNFVAKEGLHTDSIPPAEVNRLVHAFHEKKFFSMNDRYENRHVTDLPSTTTAFESGKDSKSVYNYYGAPAELKDLEKMIDSVAHTAQWIQKEQ